MQLLTLLSLLVPSSAYAVEVTGQIRGETVDTDGLSVPGVTIVVTSPNVQGAPTATTDDDGRFFFPGLPPGTYIVTATKSAFLPYKATGILVVTGSAAYLKIEMRPATGSAEIYVTEEAPAVDTQRVFSGAVLSRETMRDIPNAGRDYQSVTAYAPGVVGSGNARVRGSFDDSNQFYLDGVNNTDPITGTFSQNMNYDAIEEVQVVTGGMDAEYGRSLGGAVNVVTRSGGNEYHGDLQLLYSNQAMRVFKPLEGETNDSEYQNQSAAINLGGPIKKDTLWFFGSLQGDLYVNATPVDAAVGRPEDQPMEPRRWRSGYLFGKLTWRPDPAHRIWLQAQGDPTFIKNVEQDPYTLPAGETIQTQGGFALQAGHIWTQGDKGILQTQLYFQKSAINYYSVECEGKSGDGLAQCIRDLPDPWQGANPGDFNGGQYPYGYLGKRYRASVTASYTRFLDFLGHHQLKIGIQGERLQSDDIFPGVTDWVLKTTPEGGDPTDTSAYENAYLIAYDSELESHLVGYLFSAYIQDVWNPIDRLTLRPGLRFDYALLNNDVNQTAFATGTVAPRIGAAFDLTNDGKTNAHAYYGRFYDSGFLAVSDLLHQNSQGYSYYQWNPDTQGWGSEPIFSYASSNLIYDDLKNPWSDEFDVGLARDLGDGWGVDVTFTYEYSQNFWEDDEVNLIWNAEGTDVIGYRTGTSDVIFRIRTPDEAINQYTGLEISFSRQFSDNFAIMGSYTWSRAYGTNDSQFATGVFDNPEQVEYETGLLSFDRTHAVKILGSMRDPRALKLGEKAALGYLYGWNYFLASGYPYRPVYYNEYYGDWYNYQNALDNSYRLPARSQLDLKAGLTLSVGKTSWDLTAECFNVLNDRTVLSVDTTYGNETGDGVYTDEDGNILFGRPLTRQNPRYFQVGLRGEF